MSAQSCEFCGSPAHVWFNCPKKPDGWRPERLRPKIAVSATKVPDSATPSVPPATSKRGRPRIHPDRKAYKAQKERERRARLKSST